MSQQKRVAAVTALADHEDNRGSSAIEASRVMSLEDGQWTWPFFFLSMLNLVLQPYQYFCELPTIISIHFFFSLSIRKTWFPVLSFKNSN